MNRRYDPRAPVSCARSSVREPEGLWGGDKDRACPGGRWRRGENACAPCGGAPRGLGMHGTGVPARLPMALFNQRSCAMLGADAGSAALALTTACVRQEKLGGRGCDAVR